MTVPQKNQTYTYEDYVNWNLKEGERYELIDGLPYLEVVFIEKICYN
ncbi:MAG: hypothetical protein FWG45_04770 [Oscillospiraceae bacterium]|nr:hypothetical protein [Oscillospiraceae bacterium]